MPKHPYHDKPDESEKSQAEKDRAEQQAKRDAAEKAGNIPQVSSAPLRNYPDAQMPAAEPDEDDERPPQPQSGTAATSKEKAD